MKLRLESGSGNQGSPQGVEALGGQRISELLVSQGEFK